MKKVLALALAAVVAVVAFATIKPAYAVTDNGSVSGVVTTPTATAKPTSTGTVLGTDDKKSSILDYWWVLLIIVLVAGGVIYFSTKKS